MPMVGSQQLRKGVTGSPSRVSNSSCCAFQPRLWEPRHSAILGSSMQVRLFFLNCFLAIAFLWEWDGVKNTGKERQMNTNLSTS